MFVIVVVFAVVCPSNRGKSRRMLRLTFWEGKLAVIQGIVSSLVEIFQDTVFRFRLDVVVRFG